jgi:hypothetical protein
MLVTSSRCLHIALSGPAHVRVFVWGRLRCLGNHVEHRAWFEVRFLVMDRDMSNHSEVLFGIFFFEA